MEQVAISKLKHEDESISEQIRGVFQASYKVEAQLLGAKDFPPLKRPLEKFIHSQTDFYGYHVNDNLAAVMEIQQVPKKVEINSFVVLPSFFRRGIGNQLLEYLFQNFETSLFTVETGAENIPAITLYEKHGFKLVKKWMTEIGIEKVAFEKFVN